MLDIRNIGILAHVDAGKTTLTEQLLYLCGAVRQPGNVDEGTAQTDWLEVEKRRGISVKTACARLEYGGGVVQLIDTPGHVDFAGEVERSLAALDGAVLVLSAVEGVQAHTLLLWEALRRMDLPVLLVINKIDRAGSRVADVLDQIGRELTAACLPVQRAEGEGDAACAVLPRPFADPVFREEALLAAAEADPALEDAYLEGRPVDDETLEKALTRAARAGKLTPVLLASAKLGVGMRELMDGIVRFLPPADTRENTPLSGVVFAIEHDPVMGKAAHVRLFGGQLRNRDAVPVLGRSEMEKITQIRRISGSRATDAGVLRGGEIGALYGLPSIRAGDILGAQERRRPGRLAVPLLLVRAFPSCEEELSPLLDALRELSEEDPLLGLEWNREKREIYLRITGKIQLEILSERLAGRYRLHTNFSAPSVIYKETPAAPGEGSERYTMPKPCWACLTLRMEPLPRGSGIVYRSVIKEKELPYRYQHHVETSVRETLAQGIHGWEVTDAAITLTAGEHHPIHTHPLDFFVATPVAFLRALTACGSRLLEPLVQVRLTAGEAHLGRVIGDILAMRGEFDSPVVTRDTFTLEAVLPVATSLDYPVTFRSLTSGKGSYSSRFAGYRECPPGCGEDTPRRGVDPLDRARWILHARSAM
ncbi:GTP-binding protein [Anaeromassilibacillus sp. SJQ-5]